MLRARAGGEGGKLTQIHALSTPLQTASHPDKLRPWLGTPPLRGDRVAQQEMGYTEWKAANKRGGVYLPPSLRVEPWHKRTLTLHLSDLAAMRRVIDSAMSYAHMALDNNQPLTSRQLARMQSMIRVRELRACVCLRVVSLISCFAWFLARVCRCCKWCATWLQPPMSMAFQSPQVLVATLQETRHPAQSGAEWRQLCG